MQSIFKGNTAHIIVLIMLLVAILIMMSYLKSDKASFMTTDIPTFEGQFKVIDNKYYNQLYHFQLSIPDRDWETFYVEKIDSLRQQDNSKPILDNINILLEMSRRHLADTLAKIQVGVIDLNQPRTPQNLANQCLNEIRSALLPADTLKVVQEITLAGSGVLRGAYYMIEFPEHLEYRYPIQIAMFFVYERLAYSIVCWVRNEGYELLRTDFENVLKSFRLFKARADNASN